MNVKIIIKLANNVTNSSGLFMIVHVSGIIHIASKTTMG